ncbi:MAG: hypothetical protein ACI9T7_001839 [Oleiphilaceae bacterium]|jgi:hypothetical protein
MSLFVFIKATAITLAILHAPVMNASDAKNVDWKYLVKYDGEDVGYSRIVHRPTSNGERLAEMSAAIIPSFWGDMNVYSFKFEHYNNDHKIVQAEYAMLYDNYLLLTRLRPTQGARLKQSILVYQLDRPKLALMQSEWSQTFEHILSNELLTESFSKEIQDLKPTESNVIYINPKDFDITLSSLSIRLHEEILNRKGRALRVFDLESEVGSQYYDITIQTQSVEDEKSFPHQKNMKQDLHKVNVTISNQREIEYWYDLSTQPVSLVKVVDASPKEHIEILLIK